MSAQLGIRLREERKRLGLTQADAALLAGVRREQWSHYERGALPNADALIRLVGHGFDINYLVGGSRSISAVTMTEAEELVLELYRSTDEEGRAAIVRMCRMEADRVAAASKP